MLRWLKRYLKDKWVQIDVPEDLNEIENTAEDMETYDEVKKEEE